MRNLFLIMSIALLSMTSLAQKVDNSKIKINQNVKTDSVHSELKTENGTYKILYEDIKKNNQELTDSFQWSIGSILLIIIAIFGGSIYYNFRFNKNELSNLMQKVNLKIQEIKNDLLKEQENDIKRLESNINEKTKELSDSFKFLQDNTIQRLLNEIKDFKSKIENNLNEQQERTVNKIEMLQSDFSKNIDELSKNYQNQLFSFNENYKQQINTLNINVNKQVDTVNENTNKLINSLTEVLNIKVQTINNDISKINDSLKDKDDKFKQLADSVNARQLEMEKNIKREVARTNALLWEHKGVFKNSIRYHIQEISLMFELGWKVVDFYYNEIIENLSNINGLNEYDYNLISKFTELIPSESFEFSIKIKELIDSKKE